MYPWSSLCEKGKVKQHTFSKRELCKIDEFAIWKSRFTCFFNFTTLQKFPKNLQFTWPLIFFLNLIRSTKFITRFLEFNYLIDKNFENNLICSKNSAIKIYEKKELCPVTNRSWHYEMVLVFADVESIFPRVG